MTDDPIEGNLDGESLKTNKFEMKVIKDALTFYYEKKVLNQINKELGK